MPNPDTEQTVCNARLKGNGDTYSKAEPGPHAGEGYCNHPTDGGRCRMHGGRPIKHGLYSAKREELSEKLRQAQGEDAPGNMWTEVAVLRALLSDFLENLEGVDTDAIDGATKLQKEIRRTVDTIHEQMHREAPSEEEIERLVTGFAMIIESYVPEPDKNDALDELETIAGDDRTRALESGR